MVPARQNEPTAQGARYVDAARLRATYRDMGAVKPPPAPGFETPKDEMTPGGNFTQMDLLDALPKNVRIAKYGAMMSSDFLACETVKARAIRSLPVHVMRKGERGPEKAEDHPLNLVLRRPNALMAWGDLVSWAQLRRDVFGTAYMRIYRDMRGNIKEIRPVVSAVTVSFDRATGIAVYSGHEDYYNEKWTCREDDLLVLKTDVSEDGGKTGRSIAEMCADDIGLSIDLTRFYRALIENGNHFQGYFETDQRLDLDDIRAIKDKLDVLKGPDGAGQSPIWDAGLKYHEVSIKLDGMQLVDQERFVLEKVCRACHVDMHHVYADSGAAATAAAGADLDFAKNTVLPEVTAWEQAFQILLDRSASLAGKPSDYYVKFNMTGLERADTKTRMEAHRIAVYSGIYSRAHACELEEIAWMPGQDELLQPTAYYVLDEDGNPTVPDARTLGTSGQSDGVSGIDRKAVEDSIRILADDAADRIAKRAVADGDTAKTRDFAWTVMQPVVLAARRCGMEINPEMEIQIAIDRGAYYAR